MSDETIIYCMILISLVLLIAWSKRNTKRILKSEFINEDYLMLTGFCLNNSREGRRVFIKHDKGCRIIIEEYSDSWWLEVYNYQKLFPYKIDVTTTEELRSGINKFMKTK